MKRLWIYPSLLPILAAISALLAIALKEWHFPNGYLWQIDWPACAIFGVPVVLPAILLDLWRNKRRDIALEKLAHNLVLQWGWLTFYATCVILFFWTFHLVFSKIIPFNWGFFDFLDIGSADDLPYFVQPLFFLWAIERVTGRKPSPSPTFLWRRWKCSWTLET